METTINSLQKMIEKKAEKKLKNDLLQLYEYIDSNRLLTSSNIPLLMVKHGEKVFDLRLSNLLLVRGQQDYNGHKRIIRVEGIYALELFQHWLPIYIQEETEAFVNNVDSFKKQVDDLINPDDF